MFEKIPISSSIDCGYRDGKLTAVYFWIQHPYLNEVQSVIDLLTKRYGKYRQLSYGTAVKHTFGRPIKSTHCWTCGRITRRKL